MKWKRKPANINQQKYHLQKKKIVNFGFWLVAINQNKTRTTKRWLPNVIPSLSFSLSLCHCGGHTPREYQVVIMIIMTNKQTNKNGH